ncbi:hypothetical protein [Micromonospora sp. U21]|uniref:hypothetical protein n=1 Tax=Micromonospora sp. U21 TaxID=2824899 RepID=UPI001B3600F8|nr:hypothetical protein [Micromonospora sp. U21]MBQ0904315.1 hypothetical protein [Micromonospora sp. U21]
MPLHIQRGLGLIGFGLLLGFVGLIWTANLFGVADEHARRIARSRMTRWTGGHEVTPEEMKHEPGFLLGRYIAGIGFMLFGLLVVGGGVVYLTAPPAE